VLEEKRFERVGGTQEIEVNVRILTATNKDLHAAIAEKTFREDLYFRISAVPITIPAPARPRRRRFSFWPNIFWKRFRREFSQAGLEILGGKHARAWVTYAWPGNVASCRTQSSAPRSWANGPEIDASALQLPAAKPSAEQLPEGMLDEKFQWEGPLEDVSQRAVAHVERFKIQNALRESKWNKTRARPKSWESPTRPFLHKIRGIRPRQLVPATARSFKQKCSLPAGN